MKKTKAKAERTAGTWGPRAFPAAFAAWYGFMLCKTLAGSGATMRQGLGFFHQRLWATGPAVVPRAELARAYAADLLCLAAVAAAADGFGSALLRLARPRRPKGLERRLLAQGLGLGAMSLSALGLGACGLVVPAMSYGLVGIGCCLALAQPAGKALSKAVQEPWGLLGLGLAAFLAYAFLLQLIGALGPETFYDSLVYHLTAPKLYLLRGVIGRVENNLYADFPGNMEMLYLLGLLLRGELAAKLLHFWMLALTTLAAYAMGRAFASRLTGLLAAALFCLVPVVSAVAWHAGAELGVAFWQTMGAWALIRAVGTQSEADQAGQAPPWLLASGFFCGLAMGAKYTAIWGALATAAAAAFWLARSDGLAPGRKAWLLAAWGLAACAALSPWLVKNWALAGNPVHPFLSSLFGDREQAGLAAALAADARGDYWYGGLASWRTFVLTPWQLFVQGRNPFSFIGPLLVAFAPLLLLARRAAFPFGWIAALFVLQYAAWSGTSSLVRLLIPALPLYCVYVARQLTGARSRLWAWAVWPLLAWHAAWNGVMLLHKDIPRAVFGQETRSGFLNRDHFGYSSPYYDIAEAMDQELGRTAKILLVGDARAYHLTRDGWAASCFDRSLFLDALAAAGSARGLHAALRSRGFTHVLISFPETARLLGRRLAALPPDRLRLLSRFARGHLRKLRRNAHNVELYELREPRGPVPRANGPGELPEIVWLALNQRPDFKNLPREQRARLLMDLAD